MVRQPGGQGQEVPPTQTSGQARAELTVPHPPPYLQQFPAAPKKGVALGSLQQLLAPFLDSGLQVGPGPLHLDEPLAKAPLSHRAVLAQPMGLHLYS